MRNHHLLKSYIYIILYYWSKIHHLIISFVYSIISCVLSSSYLIARLISKDLCKLTYMPIREESGKDKEMERHHLLKSYIYKIMLLVYNNTWHHLINSSPYMESFHVSYYRII